MAEDDAQRVPGEAETNPAQQDSVSPNPEGTQSEKDTPATLGPDSGPVPQPADNDSIFQTTQEGSEVRENSELKEKPASSPTIDRTGVVATDHNLEASEPVEDLTSQPNTGSPDPPSVEGADEASKDHPSQKNTDDLDPPAESSTEEASRAGEDHLSQQNTDDPNPLAKPRIEEAGEACGDHTSQQDTSNPDPSVIKGADSDGEDHTSQAGSNDLGAGEAQNNEKLRELQGAIENGRVEDVKKLLDDGVDSCVKIDDTQEDGDKGQTLLYLAARHGHQDVVEEILKRKPDLEARVGNLQWAALHIATKNGHDSAIQLLLDAGADIEVTTKDCESPLFIATDNGCESIMELLFQRGSNVESRAYDGGWTVLHVAAYRGLPTVIQKVLEHGADIKATTNIEGVTALSIAAGWNRGEAIEILLKNNADVTGKNNEGQTPLYVATDCGHVEAIKILLSKMDRAGIVSETKSGDTALYRAAENRKEEVVLLLMESDAYLPASPQIGVTSMASPREYKAVGDLLLDQMEDAESTTRKRLEMVLYWAMLNGHETLVQECVKHGQDLKSWTQNGATLLHVVASNGHKKLVLDLLEIEGVDIEAKTKNDVTAMHLAAGNGHDAVVSVLLEKLKEPNRWLHTIIVETTDGETALSLAVKRKHQQVEQLLWTEMERANLEADPEAADKALIWAAKLEKPGQERILGLLLKKRTLPEKGGWLDKPEEVLRMASDRWTALHWAVYHGCLEVVWWLLVRGGHLRAKDMKIAKTIAKKMKERKVDHDAKIEEAIAPNEISISIQCDAQNTSSRNRGNEVEAARSAKAAYSRIFDLLHSPPPVMGLSAWLDLDEKPMIQTLLPEKEKVCKSFAATIVDFYHQEGRIDFLYRSSDVFDVVYGLGPERIMSDTKNSDIRQLEGLKKVVSMTRDPNLLQPPESAFRAMRRGSSVGRAEGFTPEKQEGLKKTEPVAPGKSKAPTSRMVEGAGSEGSYVYRGELQFRWFHVAANNMDWIEVKGLDGCPWKSKEINAVIQDLMKRIFRDSGKTNREHRPLSEFVRRSWNELSGGTERVPYMKPQCTKEPMIPRTQETKRDLERYAKATKISGWEDLRGVILPEINSEAEQLATKNQERTGSGQGALERATPGQATPDQDTIKREKEEKELPGDDKLAHPQLESNARKSKLIKEGLAGLEPTKIKPINESSADGSASRSVDKVAIYMPYLTFSAPGSLPKEAKTPKDGNFPECETHPTGSNEAVNALNLHKELMKAYKEQVVHESRTLDQYYYSCLPNTDHRDDDQVVTRYFKLKGGVKRRMLRVDQLWLWVIDEKTVITSSTNRLDDEEDPVLESIFNDLIEGNDKRRPPPSSVEQMRELIMSVTTGFIGQHKVEVDQNGSLESTLQIFENSINNVSDAEANLFLEFKCRVDDDDRKRDSCHQPTDAPQSPDNPYYSIHKEMGLLREIKDVRDELNILKSLMEDQKDVWNQAFGGPRKNTFIGSSYMQSNYLAEAIEIIGEMDKDAERVQNGINSLLDLKQKQANILEAVSGRKQAELAREQTGIALRQAEDTARQGNTIMVFTIVTIIFLPMSFLASLFALDITSFPHQSTNLVYTPGWIFPIMFCATALISTPLIFVAFNVNQIIDFWKGDNNSKQKPSAPSTPSSPGDETRKLTVPEPLMSGNLRKRRTKGFAEGLASVTPQWLRRAPKEGVHEGEANV